MKWPRLSDRVRQISIGIALVCLSPLVMTLWVIDPSPKPNATELDHDHNTDAVISAINASGDAYFGGVTWRGRRAMRISVCNWRTTDSDVATAVAAAKTALLELQEMTLSGR
jgi:hypothetical protein